MEKQNFIICFIVISFILYYIYKNILNKNIKGSETVDFLNMVVEHVDGYSDRSVLSQLFEVLPLKDIRKIRKVYNLVSPTLNKKQTQDCKNCGHSNEREVPFSLGWFWPDTTIS